MTEDAAPYHAPGKRTSRGSYERTVAAILEFASQNGTLPSARKIREVRGNGSLTDIAEHVRRFCAEMVERTRGKTPEGIPPEAVGPVTELMDVIRAQERDAADERAAAATRAAEEAERRRLAAQDELGRVQRSLKEAHDRLRELDERRQQLESSLDTKTSDLADVNRRFTAALEQARATETALREQVDAAQAAAKAAEDRENTMARERDELRAQCERLEARAQTAEAERDAGNEKIQALRTDRENLVREREDAVDAGAAMRKERADALSKVTALQHALDEANAKIEREKKLRRGRRNRPLPDPDRK